MTMQRPCGPAIWSQSRFSSWFLALVALAILVVAGCNVMAPVEQLGSSKQALSDSAHVLSGTVYGGGTSMAGALVEAVDAATATVAASAPTDSTGKYSLTVEPATYDLRGPHAGPDLRA